MPKNIRPLTESRDVALNDQQNGWQNGPRIDNPNNDRERDSWRSDDRCLSDNKPNPAPTKP